MTQPMTREFFKNARKMRIQTMGQLMTLHKAWRDNYERLEIPKPIPAKTAKIEYIVKCLADKGWRYGEFMEVLKRW